MVLDGGDSERHQDRPPSSSGRQPWRVGRQGRGGGRELGTPHRRSLADRLRANKAWASAPCAGEGRCLTRAGGSSRKANTKAGQ